MNENIAYNLICRFTPIKIILLRLLNLLYRELFVHEKTNFKVFNSKCTKFISGKSDIKTISA